MRKNIIRAATVAGILLLAVACEKPEIGYLSDNIFYNNSIYYVERGKTTYSSPIVANGSSSPLNVELLKVKDSEGKDVTEVFKKPQNIKVYDQPVTYLDSTMALLNSRFKDSIVQPFRINPIGGRMEFTPATTYLPGGTYSIDLKVSNTKGEKTIEDAAKIVLTNSTGAPYSLVFKRVRDYSDGSTLNNTDDENITVDVDYVPGTQEETKCIYKFVDKNGVAFNPKAGEISRWLPTWPWLNNWDPYFKPVLTDTAIEHQMPGLIGFTFPYFNVVVVEGQMWDQGGDALSYFKIPKGHLNEYNVNIQVAFAFRFHAQGTYNITVHLHKLTRK
ncbi:hypothetical protein [Flavobacterium aquicola]|uniref:DUF5007 domain-containing protein n=1 Tax=Flavobacterium aquicola TaxID=1682742 RepID=A0A3E0ETH0_9FLAO|nr:hypothetical protein [Flavobacterium aquicola]REH00961.1 hypothetical protein C8P67_102214 [Flavobacterium aquicola]